MRRLGTAVVLVLLGATLCALPASPTHAAADCVAVSADEVRYDAILEASVVPGDDACFELPGDADDAYVLAAPVGAEHIDLLRVDDGFGATVCDFRSVDWPLCPLEGEPPFRLVVPTTDSGSGDPVTIGVRALRVTTETGCPSIAARPFGSGAQLTGTSLTDIDCRTFHLPEGGHPMLSVRSATSTLGMLIDPAGTPLCTTAATVECAPGGGVTDGTLIVSGAAYRATLYDAASSDGCRAGPRATWGATPVTGRWRDLVQVDCLLLSGQAGDVIVPTVDSAAGLAGRVVSGDGEPGCAVDTQCRLQGPPPYRMLVSDGFFAVPPLAPPVDYRALAPSLEAGSGCPLLRPRPYGEDATDRHPGIGCRQFDVLPGQRLALSISDLTDDPLFGAGWVIGPDGRYADRSSDGVFFDPPPGRYSMVAGVFGADFVTMLHSSADVRGCGSLAADLSTVNRRLPLAGADCFVLDSLPGDEVLPISRTTDTAYAPRVVVVDATGAPVCDPEAEGYCTLGGVPPFRAIVGEGPQLPYVLAVLDRADPPTCRSMDLGPRSGTLVQLSAESQVACLTLPDDPRDPGSVRFHAWRLAGAGGASVSMMPESVGCDLSPAPLFYPVRSYVCFHPSNPAWSADLLLIGDGHDQVFYVATTPRATSSLDEPGITRMVNVVPPRLQGRPVVGQRLRAKPGRWAPGVPQVRYSYRWTVGGKVVPGAKGRVLRLRPAYLGKKVRVQVTARTDTLLRGKASSKQVRVRRR